MTDVLRITFLGAGLVLVGLFIIWLLMDLLVRITSREKTDKKENGPKLKSTHTDEDELLYKQKAAAASIAVAKALLNASFSPSHQTHKQEISHWQAAHRSQQMNDKSRFRGRYK